MKERSVRPARTFLRFLFSGFLLWMLLPAQVRAFSLIGPYASWMDVSKGYRQPGDIGGPMNIGEGYRWNLPVVTYGFDRSFRDYFGSNGVAAVESAFQVLNQIPSASSINLTNYPANVWGINYSAQAGNVIDLKTMALSLVLEHMGLASPIRYVFCIRDYQLVSGANYLFYVTERNFDPATAQPSPYINDTLFTYELLQFTPTPTLTNVFCDAVAYPPDPFAGSVSTVTEFVPDVGFYAANLSQDDVGGLRYLLNGNQVNFESLLSDVLPSDTNTVLVRSAYRPGIEHITFVLHPASALSGAFRPFTNQWTDVFYDEEDLPNYQSVKRVTTTPDILFTAHDLGPTMLYQRTGTTNWENNADANGNFGGAGPGVIRPLVVIALNNTIPAYYNEGWSFPSNIIQGEYTAMQLQAWASFDGSTNAPFVYPAGQVLFQPTHVRFKLTVAGSTNAFAWTLPGVANGRFLFQTTTNWNAWTTLASLTNSGVAFDFMFKASTNEPSRFFRLSPAP